MAHSAESESDREEDSTEAPLDGAQEEVFFPWGDRLPERRGKSGMRFFKSFERQGETYKLGDVCFLDSGDTAVPNYIGKLVELWDEGPGTQQTCQVRWFFRPNKDIDADARGLRDWRQSLNELPKNKRAQKKKEVFISFNERPNDTENIEDHNSLVSSTYLRCRLSAQAPRALIQSMRLQLYGWKVQQLVRLSESCSNQGNIAKISCSLTGYRKGRQACL
jgi:hypothetical protein